MLCRTKSAIAAGLLALSTAWAAPPQLADQSLSSREGYATVSWRDDGDRFEVEVTTEDGEIWSSHRVEGTSLFLSGLVDGDYAVRVRSVDALGSASSDWSEVLTLNVTHHGRELTAALFVIGLTVVAMTAGFILVTQLRARHAVRTGTGSG